MRVLSVLLLLPTLACTTRWWDLDTGSELQAQADFTGIVVSECVNYAGPSTIGDGCLFRIGIKSESEPRDVFVPWGGDLYKRARNLRLYEEVRIEVVNRPNETTYVLQSIY